MPVYEWECPVCGGLEVDVVSVAAYSSSRYSFTCTCDGQVNPMRRRYSFSAPPMFTPHFNVAAGKFVSSRRELEDHYKAVNDDNHARGRPSNLQPLDMAEVSRADLSVTDDGLATTYDAAVAEGRTPGF